MYADSSALGLVAVLMQQDVCGKHSAVAFASRTLNQADSNYFVNQETLVGFWVFKHFWDIILGYPTAVFEDQAVVIELFRGRNLTGTRTLVSNHTGI